jgi:hypothetical protein
MPENMLFLLIFAVNNRDKFLINSEIHNIDARHKCNLNLCPANSDIYLKRVHCSGIKVFNILPFNNKKCSDNPRTFTSAL